MKGKTLEVIDCSQLKGPPRKGDGRDITTIAWSVSYRFQIEFILTTYSRTVK